MIEKRSRKPTPDPQPTVICQEVRAEPPSPTPRPATRELLQHHEHQLKRGSAPGCGRAVSDRLSPTTPLSHDRQTLHSPRAFPSVPSRTTPGRTRFSTLRSSSSSWDLSAGTEGRTAAQSAPRRTDRSTQAVRASTSRLPGSVLCTGPLLKRGTQPAGPASCSLTHSSHSSRDTGVKQANQAAPRATLSSLASLGKVYPGAAIEAKSRGMQTRHQRTRRYPGKRSTRTHHNHRLPRQADGSELRVELSYG